jgi:3-oxoacyl-[acyl-carrier protein] reductase
MQKSRPIALVTGVGRPAAIATGIAARLVEDGWDRAITAFSGSDQDTRWGGGSEARAAMEASLAAGGGRVVAFEADLGDPLAPARVLGEVASKLGPVTALVLCHTESIDSGILDTTVDSFDRHYAVNVRANWLLIREFATRFSGEHGIGEPGTGRIVALTSDATRNNVPYGASKGALDRVVIAAAVELADKGISANVLNPGPINTGWMTEELAAELAAMTPAGRLGTPRDTAALVSFLLSEDGGWISGQLLKSDGGFSAIY